MKIALRLAALPFLVVLALTLAPSTLAEPSTSPANAVVLTRHVVDLTNQQRLAKGLAPLRWNNALAEAADSYAQKMAATGFFGHDTPDGTTPTSRGHDAGYPSFYWGPYIGENLARGYRSPESVMQGWMNSEGHKHNVLLPNYTEIGVGVAVAPDGTMYWAQEFGNRPGR